MHYSFGVSNFSNLPEANQQAATHCGFESFSAVDIPLPGVTVFI